MSKYVYLFGLHRTQSLPCLKGGAQFANWAEGFCGSVCDFASDFCKNEVHFAESPSQKSNRFLTAPLRQGGLRGGADFARKNPHPRVGFEKNHYRGCDYAALFTNQAVFYLLQNVVILYCYVT